VNLSDFVSNYLSTNNHAFSVQVSKINRKITGFIVLFFEKHFKDEIIDDSFSLPLIPVFLRNAEFGIPQHRTLLVII